MPYDGQQASKGGHSFLIKNPDVSKFLDACDYMKTPGPDEGKSIAATYLPAPTDGGLPKLVVATDGSPFSDPISDAFPSTQVGYVKTSFLCFDMTDFNGLVASGSKFVDPHSVAEFHNKAKAIAFTLPGSNVRYKNSSTVQDGFRLAIFEQLSDNRTKIYASGQTVLDTLFAICEDAIQFTNCPSCGDSSSSFSFKKGNEKAICKICNGHVYATDVMRIHEQISDYGDNGSAITRFMNAIEHLLMCTLIKTMFENNIEVLSSSAFVIDGPLALFGQPAKIHAPLLEFYNSVFKSCIAKGLPPPLIIGLQKDGQVMEHARSLSPFLAPDTYCVVSDEYRSKYINGISPRQTNFGHETYYGQDFIFKTASGYVFDVCLPYPIPNKTNRDEFAKLKCEPKIYEPWLARAFDLIRHLEFDLYENAVIPIALAHRHASISLKPGGTMLDILTKKHLG